MSTTQPGVADIAAARRERNLARLTELGMGNPDSYHRALERAQGEGMGDNDTKPVTVRLTEAEIAEVDALRAEFEQLTAGDATALALAPGGWSRAAFLRLCTLRGLAAVRSDIEAAKGEKS